MKRLYKIYQPKNKTQMFRVFVSCTSIFQNQDILLTTLRSIQNQSLKPERLFIFLSKEPYLLDQGFQQGMDSIQADLAKYLYDHQSWITVEFVPNTGPYRKLLPLLDRYVHEQNVLVVTIDDDTVYPSDLLENMVNDFVRAGGDCCVSYRGFTMVGEWANLSYENRAPKLTEKCVKNFATGKGGVLYPIGLFAPRFPDILKREWYQTLCPTGDDIWFNLNRMALNIPLFVDNSKQYMLKDLTRPELSLYTQYNLKDLTNTKQIRQVVQFLMSSAALQPAFNAEKYWEDRYKSGSNSGSGSYGKHAEWKGQFMQSFIDSRHIQSIIDVGCGDGNQLGYFKCPTYFGLETSPTALEQCTQKYKNDKSKVFVNLSQYLAKVGSAFRANCVISLDVLLCLVDPAKFDEHLKVLFNLASNYVVIYAADVDRVSAPHIIYRKFTDIVREKYPNWVLMEKVSNPLINDPETSFYVYKNMVHDRQILQSWRTYMHASLFSLIGDKPEGNIYTYHLSVQPNPGLEHKQYNFSQFFRLRELLDKKLGAPPLRVLEIGFNTGFSALLMLLAHTTLSITCVDIGAHPYVGLCANVLNNDFPGRLEMIMEDSRKVLPKLTGPYDVIHLDGDHSPETVREDFKLALAMSRPGTIWIVDDTNMSHINQIVNEYIASKVFKEFTDLDMFSPIDSSVDKKSHRWVIVD